ncbi:MAG: fumarylacetoacetate hydrolase family protein, partial [Lachnospiraceae bacterium]|nr:fumarylacetoacetate hydrolase family protein [Lachnospiraceae bacterium]
VIKKDAKNVTRENVRDYIFGYTIMNDVSAREVQNAHKQWYFGKSLDNFTPLGPWITTDDAIEYPPKLKIQSKVNGELRQDSNTELFLTDIEDVIVELSQGMTLKAGTLIATGTPSGVGMGFVPPKFLNVGDVVECIVEGIGTLRNTIVE